MSSIQLIELMLYNEINLKNRALLVKHRVLLVKSLMAASKVYIPNMLEAIQKNEIPGKFSDDKTTFVFNELRYTNSRKATLYWNVSVRLKLGDSYLSIKDEWLLPGSVVGFPKDSIGELIVTAGQLGGKVREVVPTFITSGKNLGKVNATNQITQAIRDALSLYNKQRKKADGVAMPAPIDAVSSESSIQVEGMLNQQLAQAELSDELMPPPMLMKKLDATGTAATRLTPQHFEQGITLQRKLNGVRYITFLNKNNEVISYSRSGTIYPGQKQIVESMKTIFDSLPDDMKHETYFDGELYVHGESLQKITGQARREVDEGKLDYHIYDVFFPRQIAMGKHTQSRDRQKFLDEKLTTSLAHIHRVENFHPKSIEEMNEKVKEFLQEGYEGGVARKDSGTYIYGYNNYHASECLKIKPVLDDEFEIIGYDQGKGKDLGAVIWTCKVKNPIDPKDDIFNVVPNMPLEDRKKLFSCLGKIVADKMSRFERDFRGKMLTVYFNEVSTKTGKPLQPKGIVIRSYEAGREYDPIVRAFSECFH